MAKSFKVLSPFDQTLLAECEYHTIDQVQSMISKAQGAIVYDCSEGLHDRMSFMRKFANLLEEKAEEILALMISEGGKPKRDSKVEFGRALQGVEAAIAELYQFGGREVPMGLSKSSEMRRAYTRRIPLGINLVVSAFNHPLNLLIHQVLAPLLAGCPVLVKPALKTPLTAQKFVDLLWQAGFDTTQVQLVLLPDSEMHKLVSDARLGVINFIGSAGVGQQIQRTASLHTKVILEHGGAAPLIIGKRSKWHEKKDFILKSAFAHAGQVCVSLQNLFVPYSSAEEVAEALVEGASKLVVGDPREMTTDIGPMIRAESCEKFLKSLKGLESSEVLLAPRVKGPTLVGPAVLAPKVWHQDIVIKEIFAPALNILSYEDPNDVCHFLNQSSYAFQAALWSNKLSEIDFYQKRVKAQTFIVNDTPSFRVDWMPFGGFNDSGLGLGGFRATLEAVTREVMTVWNHS